MECGPRHLPENTLTPLTLQPEKSLPVLQKDRPPTLTLRSKPPEPPFPVGSPLVRTPALVTSTPLRDKYKSTLAAWPFSKPWTTENRFARAVTSTFRWWRGISIITPAGPSFCGKNFQTTRLAVL